MAVGGPESGRCLLAVLYRVLDAFSRRDHPCGHVRWMTGRTEIPSLHFQNIDFSCL